MQRQMQTPELEWGGDYPEAGTPALEAGHGGADNAVVALKDHYRVLVLDGFVLGGQSRLASAAPAGGLGRPNGRWTYPPIALILI